jgi:hypothetical protein
MKEIDRRSVVAGILCGAAVASLGLSMLPKAANSIPLPVPKEGVAQPQHLVEDARVAVYVGPRPRRRRRRWRCHWRRGRRICGWYWW